MYFYLSSDLNNFDNKFKFLQERKFRFRIMLLTDPERNS